MIFLLAPQENDCLVRCHLYVQWISFCILIFLYFCACSVGVFHLLKEDEKR